MPTPVEFAQRWGISIQRVGALREAGMPMDSFESAEAWRATRKGGVAQMKTQAIKGAVEDGMGGDPGGDVPAFDALLDMDDFISQLNFQRDIVRINRAQYLRALRENSPSASKHYNSLNKAITQLFQIRDKALGHGLATKQLINAQTALDGMRRAFALMVSKYEAAEIPMAKEANPGDAGRALGVIRAARLKIQREVFEMAQAAAASLTGKPDALAGLDAVQDAIAEANAAIEVQGVGEDTPTEENPPADPTTQAE